jgi:cutinase
MRLVATLVICLCLLSLAAPLVEQRTSYVGGSQANDVLNGVCAPLTFIFARGTTEISNLGSVIGPGVCSALSRGLGGNVALQGVNYAASIEGNFNGGAEGGRVMPQLIQRAQSQCPRTIIALGGCSQGASCVHSALNSRSVNTADIAAVVLFGDPGKFRNSSCQPKSASVREMVSRFHRSRADIRPQEMAYRAPDQCPEAGSRNTAQSAMVFARLTVLPSRQGTCLTAAMPLMRRSSSLERRADRRLRGL